MQYYYLAGIPYLWAGDRLVKAYVPPKHGVDFRRYGRPGTREAREPEVASDLVRNNTPWRGPASVPALEGQRPGPSNRDPNWSGKDYTPNTAVKYFGMWEPDHVKDPLDPNRPGVNPDHVKARQQTHDALVRHFVDKTPAPSPGEKKRALFMVGGPAAGKTSMLRQRFSEDELNRYVVVNPDEVKNMLPEYRRGVKQRYWPAANNTHDESSYVAKKIFDQAARSGRNIMVDGTGGNAKKYRQQMQKLRDLGYEIHTMQMNKPMEQGVKDAMNRAWRSGRYVPQSVVEETYRKIPVSSEQIRADSDYWAMYEAPPPGVRQPPRMVAEGGPMASRRALPRSPEAPQRSQRNARLVQRQRSLVPVGAR